MMNSPAFVIGLSLIVFVFFAIGSAGGGAAAESQEAPLKTVLEGVFAESQAATGAEEYEKNCVRCHEGIDPEAPILTGRTFIDRWREDTLDTLFVHISTRMPADGSARLKTESYLNILSYMLQSNSYPAGAETLTAESLENILLVGRNGPQPLPNNSLVEVVGCLTDGPNNSWALATATRPARTRNGTESSEDELKRAVTRRLGSRTFALQNFSNIRFDFDPGVYKGHKVHLKGVLIRQSTGERITPTSFESLSENCNP